MSINIINAKQEEELTVKCKTFFFCMSDGSLSAAGALDRKLSRGSKQIKLTRPKER